MAKNIKIGIAGSSVFDRGGADEYDLETRFRMVKDSEVFDYYDKSPAPGENPDDYLRLSEKYDLPIRAGGYFYTLGRDETLLEKNLEIGARLGSNSHNTQVLMHHADGHLVSNEEIAETYLRFHDIGSKVGCLPTFEVHVNMWSEHFGRIAEVGDLVEARGVPFYMTLDHSHVIFKIDNPEEQEVLGLKADIEAGKVILDPFTPGNVCEQWIARGFVRHAHARPAIPNNPKNIWGKHDDGRVGRGIQYPFFEPAPGEYHAPWDVKKLEPWKQVVRSLLAYHAKQENSPLEQIATEMIAPPDYGMGAKYNNFEHSKAVAQWIRATWREIQTSGA